MEGGRSGYVNEELNFLRKLKKNNIFFGGGGRVGGGQGGCELWTKN